MAAATARSLKGGSATSGNGAYVYTIDFEVTCGDVIRWSRERGCGNTGYIGGGSGAGTQGRALCIDQAGDGNGFAHVGADLEGLIGEGAVEQLHAVERGG